MATDDRINTTVTADDQIIAVMGPTGAGKSHFIDTVANNIQWAGQQLKSVTQEVRTIRLENPETKEKTLVLVDTPGFDDTTRSDMDVLEMVADWLAATYKNGLKLAGIIYVHRITDNRMGGTPHRNLCMFGKLCGENAASRVVLTTTMWDKLKGRKAIGEAREKELKGNYWKTMIENKATTHRFGNTRKDASKIISDILKTYEEQAVLLQEELVDFQRRLGETQAGQMLYTDLQNLLGRQKETLQALAQQEKGKNNPKLVAELEAEKERISQEFEKTFTAVQRMKISFDRRIWLFFTKKLPTKGIHIPVPPAT